MKKKAIVAVVALSLALVCAIGGTLAFLVAESKTVTNTFTYGKIEIELWENEVDENGVLNLEKKDYDGIVYEKIVPGDVVNKNPTVTVKEGSEACYVYALVTNNLISTANPAVNPVATINIESGWETVRADGNATLYRYTKNAQNPGNYKVFETVKFSDALTAEDVESLKNINEGIVITAYAHQADNTDVDTADAAATAWAWPSN